MAKVVRVVLQPSYVVLWPIFDWVRRGEGHGTAGPAVIGFTLWRYPAKN